MLNATTFAFVNVGIGFIVSWALSHYLLPWLFNVPRHAGRSLAITMVYTVAAIIRNIVVFYCWGEI